MKTAKTQIIPFRATPTEARSYNAAARSERVTLSEWIRSVLNAARPVGRPTPKDK